ncbi:MAG TPA: hypothetical protein VF647_18610 [Longimicrobium sp.]|jgi:hypothetical protein
MIKQLMKVVGIVAAVGLAVLGGEVLRGPTPLHASAECEKDYCYDGWFGDYCKSGNDNTKCNALGEDTCMTEKCSGTE